LQGVVQPHSRPSDAIKNISPVIFFFISKGNPRIPTKLNQCHNLSTSQI